MMNMDERRPQPVHPDREESTPAPGELELVRSFLSLHDHSANDGSTLRPGPRALAWWLREEQLISAEDDVSEVDVAWALAVRDALVQKVRENMGAPADPDADTTCNEAAAETGLRPRFDDPRLVPTVDGVRGAIGRLLGVAFMAELDGSWHRFRLCADPTCTTVFYDRSKNHSAKWCSMQTCGNRNKVRAFRQRHAPAS
jgi:predicted RNA-binding Zn ribbon-like protein